MGHQGGRPDSRRDFLRTLSILLVVLAVLYSGLLLFLISGPAMEDVEGLRKLAFVVLVLAIVASGGLIFLGSNLFSIESTNEAEGGIEGQGQEDELDADGTEREQE